MSISAKDVAPGDIIHLEEIGIDAHLEPFKRPQRRLVVKISRENELISLADPNSVAYPQLLLILDNLVATGNSYFQITKVERGAGASLLEQAVA